MEAGHAKRLHRAGRDVIGLGIAAAAIILFIGTGGSVMPRVVNAWLGMSRGPEVIAANALILNIALIIFGWRRYIDLTQEIRERELAEERAQRLAETDVLTGLLNRRSIGAESGRLIEAARAAQRDVALLLLGIDNFKQINEIYGHETGDQVLVETARRLESLVPGGGAVARLGSDEFIVVLAYEIRGEEAVDRLAANLIETLAVPIELENRSIKASLSVGLARTHDADEQSNVLNNPQLCFQSLLRQADIAMSQAKKHGRKHYAWFEPSMENELRFRNELEIGIRQGIPAGEFIPYYEQQIDVGTGELVGFEMLARWRSPQLGLVSPDIFIPITEEIDLIGEVSESLMRLAFEDAKTWDPKLTLSINVSPVQLRDP